MCINQKLTPFPYLSYNLAATFLLKELTVCVLNSLTGIFPKILQSTYAKFSEKLTFLTP